MPDEARPTLVYILKGEYGDVEFFWGEMGGTSIFGGEIQENLDFLEEIRGNRGERTFSKETRGNNPLFGQIFFKYFGLCWWMKIKSYIKKIFIWHVTPSIFHCKWHFFSRKRNSSRICRIMGYPLWFALKKFVLLDFPWFTSKNPSFPGFPPKNRSSPGFPPGNWNFPSKKFDVPVFPS